MPLDNTSQSQGNGLPEGEDWQVVGHAGVMLGVRRCPDGAAVVGVYSPDTQITTAMVLTPEAAASLTEFLVNRPEGKAN